MAHIFQMFYYHWPVFWANFTRQNSKKTYSLISKLQ